MTDYRKDFPFNKEERKEIIPEWVKSEYERKRTEFLQNPTTETYGKFSRCCMDILETLMKEYF